MCGGEGVRVGQEGELPAGDVTGYHTIEEVCSPMTPVKGPSSPVPPTSEPLDDTRGSNYLASKVVEYR